MRTTIVVVCFLFLPSIAGAFMADDEIALLQQTISAWSPGERIAFWAEQFIDTPYDPDPEGEYVTREVLVADDKVDCMYLAFRAVELGMGTDPANSLAIALDKRFHSRGIMENGRIVNYGDRFRYGEDMLDSGKWGREVTAELSEATVIEGSRERGSISYIHKKDIPNIPGSLRNGDIMFFIKDPAKRLEGEIVGHIGIVKIEGDSVYIIHALGQKNRGGRVTKGLLSEYAEEMPFPGVRVSRIEK